MPRIIIWIYIIVSLANITASAIGSEELNQFTKPLLMPLLIFYVYRTSIGNTTLKVLLLCLALLFSWLGDIVLMFQSNQLYFMAGIGLFLIAQITYIVVFHKTVYQPIKYQINRLIPFIVYGGGLFYFLLPAGDFTLPIVIYGLVILVMLMTAFSRKNLTSHESYQLAFYGSMLFVLSDSILAMNSFASEVPFSGLLIMLTYTGAQLLIVLGILKHVD